MNRASLATAARRSLAADAASTLLARPWRTLASAAGILVGVASGVVTLTLAASQATEVDRAFDRQLSPLVVLEPAPPAEADAAVGPTAADLLPSQLDEISGAGAGGPLATWRRSTTVATDPRAPTRSAPLLGADPYGLAAAGARDLTGSIALLDADLAGTPLAWIGEDLARDLAIGATDADPTALRVDGVEVSVAGVVSAGTRYPAIGRAVVVSPTTAARRWGAAEQERLVVAVRRGSAATVAAHLVRGLDPGGQRPVVDATPPDGAITRARVRDDLARAGLSLSLASLGVGTLAVASVLTATVLQRTAELGLRSALGWSLRRVVALVLAEAAVLGLVASVVGTALGAATATAVCVRNGWTTVMPPSATWLPAVLGTVAAAVGGVAPALRAGRIAPTEALRG